MGKLNYCGISVCTGMNVPILIVSSLDYRRRKEPGFSVFEITGSHSLSARCYPTETVLDLCSSETNRCAIFDGCCLITNSAASIACYEFVPAKSRLIPLTGVNKRVKVRHKAARPPRILRTRVSRRLVAAKVAKSENYSYIADLGIVRTAPRPLRLNILCLTPKKPNA